MKDFSVQRKIRLRDEQVSECDDDDTYASVDCQIEYFVLCHFGWNDERSKLISAPFRVVRFKWNNRKEKPNGKRGIPINKSDFVVWIFFFIERCVAFILINYKSNKKKIGSKTTEKRIAKCACAERMSIRNYFYSSENRRNAILCNSNSVKEALRYIRKSEYIGYVFTHYFFFVLFFFFSVLKRGCGLWMGFFLLLLFFISFIWNALCFVYYIINLLLGQQLNEYQNTVRL